MADYYGSWYPAFILTGIVLICASVILLLEPVVIRHGMGKTYSLKNVDKELASRVNLAYRHDRQEDNLNNTDIVEETHLPNKEM
jgi:hypothetical protein